MTIRAGAAVAVHLDGITGTGDVTITATNPENGDTATWTSHPPDC